jgi:hypothetical protein
MPDPNDPESYDPNEDDWTVPPDSGVDADGNAVSRDPDALDEPLNPYDAALIGPEQPVDADGLPISTPDTPDNPAPASPKPMENGLEEDPSEEDEEDEDKKAPIQKRVVRKKPRLPGAKGPLEVDSVGDYLEDVDWQAIDANARAAAQGNYPQQPEPRSEPESQMKPEPEPLQDNGSLLSGPDWSFDSPSETKDKDEAGKQPSEVSGDTGETQDNSYYSTPTEKSIPSLFPLAQDATPEQLARQQEFDLSHSPSADTLTHARGQDEEALHYAMDKATDAIATTTGDIVHMLEEMSNVLQVHQQKILHLMEIVDIEEKGSAY